MAPTSDDPADARTDGARVKLCDRNSIDALCAAFHCAPTDVYVAVSMVGDRICDVHRFLTSLMESCAESPAPVSKGASLPPISSQSEYAGGRRG